MGQPDVLLIHRNTSFPQEFLQTVRQHLFLNKHKVLLPQNGIAMPFHGKFSPDIGIARLYSKMMSGKFSRHDLDDFRDLVAHEYVEARLMEQGLPYRSPSAVLKGKPDPGDAPGAHDLAPIKNYSELIRMKFPIKTRWVGWGFYGWEYKGPALKDNISNLGAVTTFILDYLQKQSA